MTPKKDSGFNATLYIYDDAGNRAGIGHLNGNTALNTYDTFYRLTDISVFDGSSAPRTADASF